MNPWIFGSLLAVTIIFVINFFMFGVKNTGKVPGLFIFLTVLFGGATSALTITIVKEMIRDAEYHAGLAAKAEGLREGWFSGVSEAEMMQGGIYQFLSCVEGAEKMTILRDPEGRIAIFRIECRTSDRRGLTPRGFYELTRNGLKLVQ